MQGKENYQEKLFISFQLSDRIPEHNFYRHLKDILDPKYLYSITEKFYGDSGQKSIYPVVLFKICLLGYLKNIIIDRGADEPIFHVGQPGDQSPGRRT